MPFVTLETPHPIRRPVNASSAARGASASCAFRFRGLPGHNRETLSDSCLSGRRIQAQYGAVDTSFPPGNRGQSFAPGPSWRKACECHFREVSSHPLHLEGWQPGNGNMPRCYLEGPLGHPASTPRTRDNFQVPAFAESFSSVIASSDDFERPGFRAKAAPGSTLREHIRPMQTPATRSRLCEGRVRDRDDRKKANPDYIPTAGYAARHPLHTSARLRPHHAERLRQDSTRRQDSNRRAHSRALQPRGRVGWLVAPFFFTPIPQKYQDSEIHIGCSQSAEAAS